jgi:D-lactate dehydrogenase (cytochrome)
VAAEGDDWKKAPSSPPSAPPTSLRPPTPTPPTSTSLVDALRAALALAHPGPADGEDHAASVLTASDELAPYGHDLYSYHSGPPPDVVVLPTSTEQVAAVVRVCAERRVPLVPRGSGTSLEGHTTTPYRGVVLDLTRLQSVVIRPEDGDVTVGAGVVWGDLNARLAPLGLFFPMDPGPGASIGGMVGTCCSGTNAVRYGTMKQHVLQLTVVLPDGSVVRTGSRAKKSVAGYDLTSLFVGSEGTLGVVTEATLRLSPLPEEVAVAVVPFPSVRAASDAVAAVVRAGVQVGAVELLDAPMIAAVNSQSGFSYPATPHLFFKFTGSHAKVVDDSARVERLVRLHGGGAVAVAADAAGRERLWEARKVALWSAAAMDPSRKIATTDVCVPVSRLPDLMAAAEAESAASALRIYAVAHAGDGNVHHFIAFDPNVPSEQAEARRLNGAFVRAAVGMGGTCTGEHGVGVGKVEYARRELGEGAVRLMQAIKGAIDPHNIMNPGKKVPMAVVGRTGGGGDGRVAQGGQGRGGEGEARAAQGGQAGAGPATGSLHSVGVGPWGEGEDEALTLTLACDCEGGHRRVEW